MVVVAVVPDRRAANMSDMLVAARFLLTRIVFMSKAAGDFAVSLADTRTSKFEVRGTTATAPTA